MNLVINITSVANIKEKGEDVKRAMCNHSRLLETQRLDYRSQRQSDPLQQPQL